MKYFIRKRKDCISSFFACRGRRKKMEAGHKEKMFLFGDCCVCVCVTNGGEVRGLGVGGKGR